MMIKPKIRVQKLDSELRVISDRLVDQYTELLKGPEEPHDGPLRIEAVLLDQETVDRFKEYLDKLKGILPTNVPLKTKTPGQITQKVNEFQDIYKLCKAAPDMEKVIEILHEHNFRFISDQLLEDHDLKIEVKDDVKLIAKTHQMMVKVLRYAKDPQNDKFDLDMMVLIQFIAKKPSEMVYFVRKGQLKAQFDKPWSKSAANMKEKKIAMVFPQYMTIDERKEWRALRRKVENGVTLEGKKLKLYTRYATEIQNMNAHETVPLL